MHSFHSFYNDVYHYLTTYEKHLILCSGNATKVVLELAVGYAI